MEDLVRTFCQQEGLSCNGIRRLSGGQINQVFLVDDKYVVRIGSGKEALQRLEGETKTLQSLAHQVPVPPIRAFGQRDGYVYQVQDYIQGQKLHCIWNSLESGVQEQVVAELASYLKRMHRFTFEHYGCSPEEAKRYDSWPNLWADRFEKVLKRVQALDPRLGPDLLEMVTDYFDGHKDTLQGGAPTLVHGDLWLGNVLVRDGHVVAILDFELAMYAPKDYELARIEEFCLYPNDYAEEDNELYCVADWVSFFQLLRKHYPELFEVEHLRERVNLYHLIGSLDSYAEWEEDIAQGLALAPAAKIHTLARVVNFVFDHGVRMFL